MSDALQVMDEIEAASGSGINTAIETITPEIAERMLLGNIANRPLDYRQIRYLAREITMGRWELNGETIKLNDTRLIDGQHRLHAVILADMPIRTLVVRGVTKESFDTIDTNKVRSHKDTLATKGEKSAALLAGALKWVDGYLKGNLSYNKGTYSNRDIEEILARHPGIRDSLHVGTGATLATPSMYVALHYLFKQKDAELADLFFQVLKSGSGLTSGDPVHVLRERLILNAQSKAKLPRDYIAALIIKAWNAERRGLKLKRLHFRQIGGSPEVFPTIE